MRVHLHMTRQRAGLGLRFALTMGGFLMRAPGGSSGHRGGIALLFLVDAQWPVSLAAALRQAGCEALHVAEIGLTTATDRRIWEEAEVRSAVLVTKDRDFAVL